MPDYGKGGPILRWDQNAQHGKGKGSPVDFCDMKMRQYIDIIALGCFCMFTACTRSDVEKGEACMQLGDYERAAAFFDAALNEDPGSPRARYGLAYGYPVSLEPCG